MNLQDVLKIALAQTTNHAIAPNHSRYDFPVHLTDAEIAAALQKADAKSAKLLADIVWPQQDSVKHQFILDLIALNREIEITEAKYRKTADTKDFKCAEEHHALAAQITTLQQHKSTISQRLFLNEALIVS